MDISTAMSAETITAVKGEAILVKYVAATQTASFKDSALMKAGAFGNEDTNNIGVVIYYGPGNGATPEQVGDYVIRKLNKRLEARTSDNPNLAPSTVDVEYFVHIHAASTNNPSGRRCSSRFNFPPFCTAILYILTNT